MVSRSAQAAPRAHARRGRPALFLLSLAALGADSAQALTTYCVGTSQELHDALQAAPDVNDDVQIKIRAGNYAGSGAGRFALTQTRSTQTITISGGWYNLFGNCTIQNRGSGDTVLTGAGDTPALYLRTGASVVGSSIEARDFTLRNPTYSGIGLGSCLQASLIAGNQMLLERLRVTQCYATSPPQSVWLDNTGGALTARDLVLADNLGSGNSGIGANTSSNGVTRLAQLSITTSAATDPASTVSGLYIGNFSNGTTYVSNSVVWGNDADAATKDITLGTGGTSLTRVHYGSLGGSAPAANIAPGSGDPGFVAPGNPRLRYDSILRDSGVANPEGGSGSYDADGASRVLGAAVDVGAFESDALFRDGFD